MLGEVLGVTACTRNPFVAGVRTLDGSPGGEVARVLRRNRAEAIAQMISSGRRRGATAIVGMRFDNRDITSTYMEICAYGTAVLAIPVTEEARRAHAVLAAAGQTPRQSARNLLDLADDGAG